VVRAIRQATHGLGALRNRRTLALVILYTIGIWGSNCVLLWLVIRAFHLAAPFAAGALGTAVVSLAMAVPSTPGYLGVFDYFTVVTLGLYGVKKAPALAAALIFHAIAFIPVTVIGIIYIARAGFQVTAQMVRSAGSSR
jgi:glycosyltransferase 2 family protein